MPNRYSFPKMLTAGSLAFGPYLSCPVGAGCQRRRGELMTQKAIMNGQLWIGIYSNSLYLPPEIPITEPQRIRIGAFFLNSVESCTIEGFGLWKGQLSTNVSKDL